MPVMFVTQTISKESVDKILGVGADEFVGRPFNPEELLARIGALIRRTSRSALSELKTLDLDGRRIDFVRSQLIGDGKATELSDLEIRLLRYLVQHKGEIVTRETLIQDVWGYQAMPDTRTITVHISRLRRKLESDPQNPRYILTVHGHGYRFCA